MMGNHFSFTMPKKPSNQNKYEKLRIKKILKDFDPKTSEAYQYLCNRYGSKPLHTELVSLALVISENLSIMLEREARRRKTVLWKWYNDHLAEIKVFLENCVKLHNEFGNLIINR